MAVKEPRWHEAEGKWLEPLPTLSSPEGAHRQEQVPGVGKWVGEGKQSRREDR